ncbi:MAG: hypothetical protein VYD85_02460, partial [Pseudomonadota bacterium]|nr:hypothetical protein [Pseudomonadota bacterium]
MLVIAGKDTAWSAMNTVVTLISSKTLTAAQCDAVRDQLDGDAIWLAEGRAADIFCHAPPAPAEAQARTILGEGTVDIVVQVRAGRRKKLLVADMESTIIQNEMLDELADELNLRDEIAAIT